MPVLCFGLLFSVHARVCHNLFFLFIFSSLYLFSFLFPITSRLFFSPLPFLLDKGFFYFLCCLSPRSRCGAETRFFISAFFLFLCLQFVPLGAALPLPSLPQFFSPSFRVLKKGFPPLFPSFSLTLPSSPSFPPPPALCLGQSQPGAAQNLQRTSVPVLPSAVTKDSSCWQDDDAQKEGRGLLQDNEPAWGDSGA